MVTDRGTRALRAASALLGVLTAAAGCTPAALEPAAPTEGHTVAYVLDGDTIEVTGPGGEKRVRLLGIDTPEVAHDDQTGECGGEEATAQLQELLPEGTAVRLVSDDHADDADRYGRLLRYVELEDGTDAGHAQITAGRAYAWAPDSEPAPERLPDYEDATATARQTHTGSWATCPTMTPAR